MGKRIFHCGKNGMGQMTKLMNQILVALNDLAACEALTFAKRVGLKPEAALEAVGGGAAGSWQLNNLGPKMLAGNFAPGFMIDLMLKDLKLVLEAAKEAGLELQATELATRLFGQAHDLGDGRLGTQALVKRVDRA
jgi:3-hydroxyisobutyrate dehydrogenase